MRRSIRRLQVVQLTHQLGIGLRGGSRFELRADEDVGTAWAERGDGLAEGVRRAAPVEEVNAGVERALDVVDGEGMVAARRQPEPANVARTGRQQRGAWPLKRG